MTVREKLALMRELEQRNTERLQKAGLLRKTERKGKSHDE